MAVDNGIAVIGALVFVGLFALGAVVALVMVGVLLVRHLVRGSLTGSLVCRVLADAVNPRRTLADQVGRGQVRHSTNATWRSGWLVGAPKTSAGVRTSGRMGLVWRDIIGECEDFGLTPGSLALASLRAFVAQD